jgi:predicted amidophosphoribosyltransferase
VGSDRVGRLLDLLLPRRCAACGCGEEIVCSSCLAALTRLRGPLCRRCGAPTAWPVERCVECARRRIPFTAARSAVSYEGAARALVAAWKERGQRHLVGVLAAVVVEVVPRPDVDALTFVPGDRDRSLWRGQNAAGALAAALAERWELEVVAVLARKRRAPRQRGLSRPERRLNVRDSFRSTRRAPPRAALVDDVYTTGATAGAAARELRRAGSGAVHVVTFARAVRR